MKKRMKAKKYHSPVIKGLLDEVSALEMRKTKEKMLLAARIDELMETNGLKKTEFAQKVGKQPSEITKWLSGTHNFTLDTLTEIAEALGIEVATFFGKREAEVVFHDKIVVSAETGPASVLISTPLTSHGGKSRCRYLPAFTGSYSTLQYN